MPIKKTYYEVLGVSRTATQEQIREKYRLLVRKYHPDVATDKKAAQAAFIEIKEAYETLKNPNKRTIYDAGMDAEMFRVPPRASQPSSSSRPNYGRDVRRGTTRTTGTRRTTAEGLIQEAQNAFVRGDFHSAISLCNEARKINPMNARAHTILGDIYRIQGRIEEAVSMYTIATQLDPNNAEIRAKLNRLLRGTKTASPDDRSAAFRMGMTLMGVSTSIFLFALLALNPGEPIPWLKMNLPFIGVWSEKLIWVMFGVGAITGMLLSVNGIVQSIEDELLLPVIGSPHNRSSSPLFLLMLMLNIFSFYAAAGVYVIASAIMESLSKSVVMALVATFMLAFITFLAYPVSDSVKQLIWGGNVIFPAVLIGWGIGDMLHPGW